MPDAIASYRIEGQTYLLTANEGDVRDWPGMTAETARLSSLDGLSPDLRGLSRRCEWHSPVDGVEDRRQYRRRVHRTDSTAAGPRCALVLDLDDRTATRSSTAATSSSRSPRRGCPRTPSTPTTAAIATGTRAATTRDRSPRGSRSPELWGRWYAFIALERIGGIMIYDVTDPHGPRFVDYVNSRDFAGNPVANTAGDLGPEMSFVIPTSDSPTQEPLLVVPTKRAAPPRSSGSPKRSKRDAAGDELGHAILLSRRFTGMWLRSVCSATRRMTSCTTHDRVPGRWSRCRAGPM